MRDGPLVRVTATLVVMWMCITVMPRSEGNLLRLILPKDTFIIRNQRFNQDQINYRSSSAHVTQRQPTVPYRQVSGPVRAPEPTRPQPIVPSRQRVRVPPTKPTFHQQMVPQHQSTSQNPFRSPQPNNGGRRTRHPSCGVMPNPGDCRAAFPRYFYNSQTDQCDCFLYGGCGNSGLQYSYRTLEECQQTCVPLNMEEGPVCKEVFGDDEVFFDAVTNPPRPYLPKPDTSHLSDERFLYLLMNSVAPENFVDYDNDEYERNMVAGNRRL